MSQRLLSCCMILGAWCPLAGADASRDQVDRAFRHDLEQLAERWEVEGRSDLAEATTAWYIPRTSDRQYLFVPGRVEERWATESSTSGEGEWWNELNAVRSIQADRLWGLAENAAVAGDASRAVALLYEVLHERPDDRRAQRALGLRLGLRESSESAGAADTSYLTRTQPRLARNALPAYGWSAGGYWRLPTDHFLVMTNHSEEEAVRLGEELEELYTVWRQLFVGYWSTPAEVRRAISGKGFPSRRTARHRVVLFRDRDEYVRYLRRHEPQAEITLGMYRDTDRIAYFHAGQAEMLATWRHEIAHQLFFESNRRGRGAGEERNFWLLEGIALYLESLQSHDGYCTVGGVDAERLQYGRYRTLQEDFYIPLDQLQVLGRVEMQTDPRLRRMYSQAAGLTHFLMDGESGRFRKGTMQVLRDLYAGTDDINSLSDALQSSTEEIDRLYREYLVLQDEDVLGLPTFSNPRKLCLGRTRITNRALTRVSRFDRLDWLDLAYCDVSDAGVLRLSAEMPLRQLNLEGTRVSDASAVRIAAFTQLEELDLSGTHVTSVAMDRIGSLPALRVLWLTDTQVTDEGLARLAGLERLELLDVGGTRVTSEAWDRFLVANPHLNRSK